MNGVRHFTQAVPDAAATARQTGIEASGLPELVTSDDVSALRAIVEGTARSTGEEFFQSLVRHLAAAMDVHYAFVAEFAEVNTRARTLAYWFRDQIHDNVEFDLAGTPCEDVVRGGCAITPRGQGAIPARRAAGRDGDRELPRRAAARRRRANHSATSRSSTSGRCRRAAPAVHLPDLRGSGRGGAGTAASPSERCRESEERYRDLYEEAPIAYVQEDLESRFISANRAALRILGLKPEEVVGTVGMSSSPTRPRPSDGSAKPSRRSAAAPTRAASSSNCAARTMAAPSGCSGGPSPNPNGKYTRTMIVDITDRVLMEQEKARLQQQNLYLQEEIKSVHNFEEIIGQSPALLAVLDKVGRVAPTDASVLITGETGTGKELIARAIHSAQQAQGQAADQGQLRRPARRAWSRASCSATRKGPSPAPSPGASAASSWPTAARSSSTRSAKFPPEAQAKLLRVLQEREFDRVGGSAPITVDVRVIAATNRDLLKAVREKTFREDLYYRLNVFPIALPPLRERTRGHPAAGPLPRSTSSRRGSASASTSISRQTMQRLIAYPWPGNVRELENVLERAVILAHGDTWRSARTSCPDAMPAAPRQATTRPGDCGAQPHPDRPRTDGLGDRRRPRRGHNPGTAPQHPAQPDEEARHHPHRPRTFVAPTTCRGLGESAHRQLRCSDCPNPGVEKLEVFAGNKVAQRACVDLE